ncbi:hypothetical protein FIV42_01035 [Persicimonas caeni]|uniref:Translocation protein TolB n=1 Tax=Persicimonas caeni TaxID=2292766 RepID=A0A4Y6PMW5_PERCE|nr:PD40 domain-containing protein [Persicimonas caeni]QDG49367.1 hypothetical protein FIV42_01035 [Persicimonas caeni]QED30588.1 hypothetical protein FRD00_01030 [Persicimonas caeni]
MNHHTISFVLLGVLFCLPSGASAESPALQRLSQAGDEMPGDEVPGDEVPGDGPSIYPTVSADGTTVAFMSQATNLVDVKLYDDEVPKHLHIFTRDLATGVVGLASRAADGTPANAHAMYPDLSADGRLLVFASRASNLVDGTEGKAWRVYVKNLETGAVQLISHPNKEMRVFWPRISDNSDYVTFLTHSAEDLGAPAQIYRHHLPTGELQPVSSSKDGAPGDGDSRYAELSANGRYVVFESQSTNLADVATPHGGVFVKDMQTGAVELVAARSPGAGFEKCRPSVSADGRRVVFYARTTVRTPDALPGVWQVAVKDLDTDEMRLASTNVKGEPANARSHGATLSADGRYVAFQSDASNLPGPGRVRRSPFYLKDLKTGKVVRISPHVPRKEGEPLGSSGVNHGFASLSADGSKVVFHSDAPIDSDSRQAQVYLFESQCSPKHATMRLKCNDFGSKRGVA